MKKLVVYYSFEGNTELLAKNIADEIGADLSKLEVKEEVKTHGFMKFFWGGKQVLMKEKPELLPLTKNPEDYDLIFIGTPVWSYTFAPALRAFFSTKKITGKKVAVFCSHEGGPGNTLEKMKEQLAGNEFVGELDFIAPLKRDKEETVKKAREWAERQI
jgi:flavodoxin